MDIVDPMLSIDRTEPNETRLNADAKALTLATLSMLSALNALSLLRQLSTQTHFLFTGRSAGF